MQTMDLTHGAAVAPRCVCGTQCRYKPHLSSAEAVGFYNHFPSAYECRRKKAAYMLHCTALVACFICARLQSSDQCVCRRTYYALCAAVTCITVCSLHALQTPWFVWLADLRASL